MREPEIQSKLESSSFLCLPMKGDFFYIQQFKNFLCSKFASEDCAIQLNHILRILYTAIHILFAYSQITIESKEKN